MQTFQQPLNLCAIQAALGTQSYSHTGLFDKQIISATHSLTLVSLIYKLYM